MRLLIIAGLAVVLTGCVLSLFFWDTIAGWLSPTVPVDPDEPVEDRPESGADATFGAELRAMREGADHIGQELLANLRASALAEVEAYEQVAASVVETYDALLAQCNARLDDILAAAKKCEQRANRRLRPDAHGRAWLAAGLPGDTGPLYDVAQLEAALAGVA